MKNVVKKYERRNSDQPESGSSDRKFSSGHDGEGLIGENFFMIIDIFISKRTG